MDKAKNGQDGTSNSFDFKLDYSHPFNDNSKLEVGLASKATDRGDIQVSEVFDQTSNQYIADRTFSNCLLYTSPSPRD